ncbi:hypothetical protein ES288_A11G363300v1 [Gossypium darwinii]|uniref:Uncharacterized protein n=1 Tax=Gossypium darwinii TaxID=34276 RepID=A0A5D2EUA2_GOSDA|nr:hypothetical protein ES288_A11G363300v1 [Gossypium darwinii]
MSYPVRKYPPILKHIKPSLTPLSTLPFFILSNPKEDKPKLPCSHRQRWPIRILTPFRLAIKILTSMITKNQKDSITLFIRFGFNREETPIYTNGLRFRCHVTRGRSDGQGRGGRGGMRGKANGGSGG